MSGLEHLRALVAGRLRGDARTNDAKLLEGVEFYLSEASVLRMFGDISGPGSTSPQFVGENDDRRMHLTVRGTMLNAQALSVDKVPMKEESQRFVNFSEGKEQGSSITATPIKVGFTHPFGYVGAPTGRNTSAGVQGELSLTAPSRRAMNANTGSGHISGLVYTAESVLYKADFRMAVEIAAPGMDLNNTPTVTENVTVYLRVPVHQQARFEEMLRHQASDRARPAPEVPVRRGPDGVPGAQPLHRTWRRARAHRGRGRGGPGRGQPPKKNWSATHRRRWRPARVRASARSTASAARRRCCRDWWR